MAIDYQVGDIVIPKSKQDQWIKMRVLDITEKYLILTYLEWPEKGEVYYKLHEMEQWQKDLTGTLLYGHKSK